MHVFTDNLDRKWEVSINIFAVKKVRALLEVDLYQLLDDKLDKLNALLQDPCKLVDVIYVLCESQAKQERVSDEDFGRGLAGDAIGAATDAFIQELIDFFPDPKARESLRKLMAAGKKVSVKLLEHGERLIEELDPNKEAEKLIASLTRQRASSA